MSELVLKQTGPSTYVVETRGGTVSFGEGATSPMETVVAALGGCLAMSISHILEVMREKLLGVAIQLSAKEREQPPSIFESINIHVTLRGENLSRKKVEKAVHMAEEEYCPVSVTLRKSGAKMKTTFDIEDKAALSS